MSRYLLYFFYSHYICYKCHPPCSMDCCSRLNKVTGPRLLLGVAHSALLLLQYSWLMLLISLPFTGWQLRTRMRVASGDFGVFDPTKIVERARLRGSIKESLVFMGYHLLSFFVYMWQLVSLLSPEPSTGKPAIHGEVPW